MRWNLREIQKDLQSALSLSTRVTHGHGMAALKSLQDCTDAQLIMTQLDETARCCLTCGSEPWADAVHMQEHALPQQFLKCNIFLDTCQRTSHESHSWLSSQPVARVRVWENNSHELQHRSCLQNWQRLMNSQLQLDSLVFSCIVFLLLSKHNGSAFRNLANSGKRRCNPDLNVAEQLRCQSCQDRVLSSLTWGSQVQSVGARRPEPKPTVATSSYRTRASQYPSVQMSSQERWKGQYW